MSSEARALLESASALLLDFDGPLAALMPPPINAQAADTARAVLKGMELPEDVAATSDHLAVLRWALEHLPREVMLEVEAACTRAEVAAAETCEPAVNCDVLLGFAQRARIPVAVVSNNSSAAVRAFLMRTGWLAYVDASSARTSDTVEWLKPRPELLLFAADALDADIRGAVFVGDAVSDVIAAKRAGCKVVGLFKHAQRKRELEQAGANVVGPLADSIVR